MIFGLFSKGIRAAGGAGRDAKADAPKPKASANAAPPLRPEELKGNLSTLQQQLNREIKCPAGQNQVYIRSLVTLKGTTPPRIALKCSFRRDAGMTPDVFLDDIRSMCCGDPKACAAYQQFQNRFCPT